MSIEISDEDFKTLLRERVKAGDPEFQCQVGVCYYWGYGIEKNYIEAMKWFKLAAAQGHAEAENDIGILFSGGLGVEEDHKEAVKWFELSAKRGDVGAQYNLAYNYEIGRGITQDYKEAVRFYNLSAEQGYWAASYNLGKLYFVGQGVEQDLVKAKACYEQALADADFEDDPAAEVDKRDTQEKLNQVNNQLVEIASKSQAARAARRTEIFISYAHKDEEYREQLCPHLEALKKTTNIQWWDDSHIKPGEGWKTEIKEALSRAKIAVLLVSARFIASEYVWNEELPEILELANNEGATILWLPVSFCDYEDTDIAKYQAVTDPKNPLAKRTPAERDEVYTTLVKRIKELYKLSQVQ